MTLAAVPFVDVISTVMDATLLLTVQEYLEWGNPNLKLGVGSAPTEVASP
jgi:protease II